MPGIAEQPDALAMPIDITAYERMQSPGLARARRAASWVRQPKRQSGDENSADALYDGACDLLAATHAMRAAAERPGSTTAIAATLACIDGMLGELSAAVEAMRRQALRDLTRTADLNAPAERAAVADTERAFRDFANALQRVRRAAVSMRQRLGPHLARLALR